MALGSKRRYRRPESQHDFSGSELGSVYTELNHEVQGNSNSSRCFYVIQIVLTFLCLAFVGAVVGELDGTSFESIRGSTISKKAFRHFNSTISSRFGTRDTADISIDHSKPIVHEAKKFNQRKRVLALGGSTTFGAKLEDRRDTYPMILSKLLGVHWEAVNLAVQATDASYASQCAESMIRDAAHSIDDMVKDFDVILLEYSLSGLDGFPLLARRLRRRYPNAVILYVHLWSLRTTLENVETGTKPRAIFEAKGHTEEAEREISLLIQDPNTSWKYSTDMIDESKQYSTAGYATMQGIQGLFYEIPVPDNPQEAIKTGWFGPDYHHLSKIGHHFVAQEIYKRVNLPGDELPALQTDIVKNDHTWGQGDQCYSWFDSGKSPLTRFIGGTMTMFGNPNKWALQVGEGFGHPATVSFENPKDNAQPVRLELMSWGPDIYPKVKVQLNSENQQLDDTAVVIEPLHPVEWQRSFHIPRTVHIGWVEPGKNSVTIDSTEVKEHPLRVTGIILCGACVEMDNLYAKIEANAGDVHDPKGLPGQTQVIAHAMAEVRGVGPSDGIPQQTAISDHMPVDGDFPSKEQPAEVFGRGNMPADGQNAAIEQLQQIQSQNNLLDRVESVDSNSALELVQTESSKEEETTADQTNRGTEQLDGQMSSTVVT